MPIGDVYQVRCVSYTPSQICVNSLYCLVTGVTGTEPSPGQLALTIDNNLSVGYIPLISTNARWRGISVQLQSSPKPVPSTSIVNDAVGGGSGDLLPAQTSYVIAFTNGIANRHGRGRIYPGFGPESNNTASGFLASAGQIILQSLANLMIGSFVNTQVSPAGTNTLQWVHRTVTKFPPPTPPLVAYQNIVTAVGRPRWATQKRRGQYGRVNILPF